MGSKERKRVTKEQVLEDAKHGDRGPPWLTLPDGVELWAPEKAGSYEIDVYPYEVKEETHPDTGIEAGTVWYKRFMTIHHGVGPNNKSYVCPASVSQKCPIHDDRAKLQKKGNVDDETLKSLDGQKYILFNIRHPEDKHKRAVFCMSSGKVWFFKGGGLKKELEESGEKNLLFWDVRKGHGRTLKVRFSEEKFKTAKFLQASRFDFEKRKDMDEDKVLEESVELGQAINVMEYDKLKKVYLQSDGSKSSKSSSGSKSSSASSSGSKSASSSASKSASASKSSSASKSASKSSSASSSASSSGSKSSSDSGSSED